MEVRIAKELSGGAWSRPCPQWPRAFRSASGMVGERVWDLAYDLTFVPIHQERLIPVRWLIKNPWEREW